MIVGELTYYSVNMPRDARVFVLRNGEYHRTHGCETLWVYVDPVTQAMSLPDEDHPANTRALVIR